MIQIAVKELWVMVAVMSIGFMAGHLIVSGLVGETVPATPFDLGMGAAAFAGYLHWKFKVKNNA